MPFKDRSKENEWRRAKTKKLNSQGLTMRGTPKKRFMRPPSKPVSDEEIDRRMS